MSKWQLFTRKQFPVGARHLVVNLFVKYDIPSNTCKMFRRITVDKPLFFCVWKSDILLIFFIQCFPSESPDQGEGCEGGGAGRIIPRIYNFLKMCGLIPYHESLLFVKYPLDVP